MSTRHVLDRLPLWLEGDLPEREAEAIQNHLNHCPDCQAAAERLRTSQAWLREALAPPFDAADHAALREAVMAQVRSAPSPRRLSRLVPRAALLAAGAAALLIAVLIPLRRRLPAPLPQVASAPSLPPAHPLPPPPSRSAPNSSIPLQMTRNHPLRMARVEPPPGPTRIEFQTSDPSIRIIWLAQATPSPDPNPPLPEAP
ncbi:MAG: zf-HC2 domain-containing protein [Acidobacteriota bacterium]|nr:zf-HC2 domain-containing protein [Acidobacteriota bacterium]